MTGRRRSLLAVGLALAALIAILAGRNLLTPSLQERLTANGDGFEGSWHFPRGGPYVLGVLSDAPVRLTVDGSLVASGKGLLTKRIVFQPGDYALRLDGEGASDARLVWHPPGRRGPVEYVPLSSLSASQDAPSFSHPGTSLLDGCCAVAIALVWISLFVFLFRKSLRGIDRKLLLWALAVFVVALAVRLWGLNAQGQTWDEDVNWSAGRNYITNLLSLDFSDVSWRWNYEHPPVMKYLAGIGAQFWDGYEVSRFLSAVVVALACALLVPIGKRLGSLRVGVLAGALACVTPHVIAHSKVVGHEAPTMLLWAIGIFLSLRAHDDSGDDDPWILHKRFAVIGVVLGLAIASRYINGLLAPLIGAILLVQSPAGQRKRTVLLGLSIIPAAAVLSFVLVWPRMWTHPLAHLQESWAKLKKPHSVEPYLGAMTNAPPRSYFLVYLWATAPLALLIAALAWVGRALHRREASALVALLWFAAPLIVMFSPVRQDGVRYVMPSILAMNMAAALGVDYVAGQASRLGHLGSGRRGSYLFGGLAGLVVLSMSIQCAKIHPYYLDYYGPQVGGPAGVARARRFEIAWWGEGMNAALEYLNHHAPKGARVYKRCFEPAHLAWMRGDLWDTEVSSPAQADWFLVYQPTVRSCPLPADAELVFEATADGAPLSRVYRRSLPH